MALDIRELRRPPEGGAYVSPLRLCLDAAGSLVDCADPAAVTLLVAEGGELPLPDAERYGLIGQEREDGPTPEAPKRRRAPSDKAAPGGEDKGSG
jgi:hypothetical protein